MSNTMRFEAGSLVVVAMLGATLLGAAGCAQARGDASRGAEPAAGKSAVDFASLIEPSNETPLAGLAVSFWERQCATAGPVDPRTTALYGKACTNGDGEGCSKLGAAYMCGAGVAKNERVAVTMFEKACSTRDADGCQRFAGALVSGVGHDGHPSSADVVRGLEVYDRACRSGAARACGSIGAVMLLAGNAAALPHGVAYLERACDGGFLDACGNLAVVEAEGLRGRAKDPERGAKLARAACEKSNAYSCGVFGKLQVEGTGTPKDEVSGAKLLTVACDAGEATACAQLGLCHYYGRGVNEDVGRATELFQKGCDGGNGPACRVLAELSAAAETVEPPVASPTMF
ncbi:MAG: sel1 repeat family protein [Labilithrix sp.]|nr:sel1 repeat family protein [Labilithrix sp.]